MTPKSVLNAVLAVGRLFTSSRRRQKRRKRTTLDDTGGSRVTPPADSDVTPSTPCPEEGCFRLLEQESEAEPVLDLGKEITLAQPHAVAYGGFADIYLGDWTPQVGDQVKAEPKIQVAIKVLRVFTKDDEDSGKTRRRLDREVRVWKRLQEHPNIAKFYGVSFQLSGRPAIVMNWYKRGTAPNYLLSQPHETRFDVVKDISQGLLYLHTSTIIHGDLKGNNVLIDDGGRGVLTDFGLAKVIDELAKPTGNTTTVLAGAVRWLAPELLFDEPSEDEGGSHLPPIPSRESDIFSLASTIYELMTGRIPYEHHLHDWKVIQDTIQGVSPVRNDDTVIHEFSALHDLLKKCWAQDPSCRPTILEVDKDLGKMTMNLAP